MAIHRQYGESLEDEPKSDLTQQDDEPKPKQDDKPKPKHKISDDGLYHVQLFDWPSKTWRVYQVDASVPTMCCAFDAPSSEPGRRCFHPRPCKPIAASTPSGALWPVVIEKAVAKHVGSYLSLSGGNPSWALELLTGRKAKVYRWSANLNKGMWENDEHLPLKWENVGTEQPTQGSLFEHEKLAEELYGIKSTHEFTKERWEKLEVKKLPKIGSFIKSGGAYFKAHGAWIEYTTDYFDHALRRDMRLRTTGKKLTLEEMFKLHDDHAMVAGSALCPKDEMKIEDKRQIEDKQQVDDQKIEDQKVEGKQKIEDGQQVENKHPAPFCSNSSTSDLSARGALKDRLDKSESAITDVSSGHENAELAAGSSSMAREGKTNVPGGETENKQKIVALHAYAIKSVDNHQVELLNPHDNKKPLFMSFDAFVTSFDEISILKPRQPDHKVPTRKEAAAKSQSEFMRHGATYLFEELFLCRGLYGMCSSNWHPLSQMEAKLLREKEEMDMRATAESRKTKSHRLLLPLPLRQRQSRRQSKKQWQ